MKGKRGTYPPLRILNKKVKEHVVTKISELSEVEMGHYFHLIKGTHQR